MENQHLLRKLLLIFIYFQLANNQPITTIEENVEDNKGNNITRTCNVALDLSNMGIGKIPKNFISSPYVKNLTLHNNVIQSIEEKAFSSLPNLEFLDLSNNQLNAENVFSSGDLGSLRSLILDNNQFFSHLENYNSYCDSSIEYYDINIGRCILRKLKSGYYDNLNYLSLRNTKLNYLPSNFKEKFPKLYYLDLSENDLNNGLHTFTNIPSTVEEMILENVGLTSLVNARLILQRLTLLKLNSNNFNTVNCNIYRHGVIDSLLCLKGLNNLKSLYISQCSIMEIGINAFMDLENLTYLDISDNKFEEIPNEAFDSLTNLLGINVSRNSLSILPHINRLENLTILIMDEMKTESISGQHRSIHDFTPSPKLEVLSMRKNKLSHLPSTFFHNIPNLRELDLSDNEIVFLEFWLWEGKLQKLHLNSNKISDIENLALTAEAKSLELLELENNSITNVKINLLKNLNDDLILKL